MPPASYNRILAALQRLSPPWPFASTDTSVGKELGSIATALGTAADYIDAALEAYIPDTATAAVIDRWEKVCRVAVRTGDDIEVRRARVLAVLRRSSGARLDQLETMLEGPLDLDGEDIFFLEATRGAIEDRLTETTGAISLNIATEQTLEIRKPWPGLVDGYGVRVYLSLSGNAITTAVLTSPEGTVWTIDVNGSGWYQTSDDFTGERARGRWRLQLTDTGATPLLLEWKLMVSNTVDSLQIYNFFVYRDPTFAGDPDLVEAQRLFHRTAHAEMRAFVIQSLYFMCGDEYSLMGRDPIGV
jgi:hypothetical protein